MSDSTKDTVTDLSTHEEADFGARIGIAALGTDSIDDAQTVTTDQFADTRESVDGLTDDPLGLFPWWTPYAAGGVGLLVLLIALRPYASIGAGVVS